MRNRLFKLHVYSLGMPGAREKKILRFERHRDVDGEFSSFPVGDVCFIPASWEHPLEREKLPLLLTAVAVTTVMNSRALPGAWR